NDDNDNNDIEFIKHEETDLPTSEDKIKPEVIEDVDLPLKKEKIDEDDDDVESSIKEGNNDTSLKNEEGT
ncbi:hypothetical protein CANINC_002250, partial [Pichia inconspicua]